MDVVASLTHDPLPKRYIDRTRVQRLKFILCAYQCYAPLPPVRAIVGQGGDLINLHINCPNIRDIPNNQIPLQKVGDYWGFDTRSVTVQYTETIAVLKVSSEVIKCPTIGAASFGQSPYVARLLPVRGVVGHNIDRCITAHRATKFKTTKFNSGGLITKIFTHENNPLYGIRESVDSLCRDGADAQYMQYLSKSRITSPQTRKKLI